MLVDAKTSMARTKLSANIQKYDNAVWVHEYDATVVGAFHHLKHAFADEEPTLIKPSYQRVSHKNKTIVIITIIKQQTMSPGPRMRRRPMRRHDCWVGFSRPPLTPSVPIPPPARLLLPALPRPLQVIMDGGMMEKMAQRRIRHHDN